MTQPCTWQILVCSDQEPRLITRLDKKEMLEFLFRMKTFWEVTTKSKRTVRRLLLDAMREGATHYYQAPGMFLIFRPRKDKKSFEKGVIAPLPDGPKNLIDWTVKMWWLGNRVIVPKHSATPIQKHPVFKGTKQKREFPAIPASQRYLRA